MRAGLVVKMEEVLPLRRCRTPCIIQPQHLSRFRLSRSGITLSFLPSSLWRDESCSAPFHPASLQPRLGKVPKG